MNKLISFVQINMNRSGLAAVELNERLKKVKDHYVCLVTEPFRYRGKIASAPAKACIVPGNIADPRATILSSIELTEITALCTRDSAVALLKSKELSILIAVSYTHLTLPTIYSV